MFFLVGITFRTKELACFKNEIPFFNLQIEASSYFSSEGNIFISLLKLHQNYGMQQRQKKSHFPSFADFIWAENLVFDFFSFEIWGWLTELLWFAATTNTKQQPS